MMCKIFKYMKITLGKSKIFYISAVFLIIFNFTKYSDFMKRNDVGQANFYDLAMYNFYDHYSLAFFYFILFLLCIYNIISRKNFYKYVFLKFKSKKEWYLYNLLAIFVSSIIFTFFIFLQCFLEGFSNFNFDNKWSSFSLGFSLRLKGFRNITNSISPLSCLILLMIYLIFYFFAVGTIFLIFSMILNKIGAFVLTLIINFLNIESFYGDIIGSHISFYSNVIILSPDLMKKVNSNIIYYRAIYWIILIAVLVIIGDALKSKIDFKFGDN